MKLNITKKTIHYAVFVGIFLLSAIAVLFLLPKSEQSSLDFQIGKPWKYNDVKAEFDFPIQKSDKQISAEQDSILKECYSYYKIDKTQLDVQKKALNSSVKFSELDKTKIASVLEKIYARGVVTVEELGKAGDAEKIYIVDQNRTYIVTTEEVFTLRTAYEFAQNELFSLLSWGIIRGEIANLILPNLTYDEAMTLKMRQEKFNKILPTYGLVQSGEKIIGNGDLVTEEKYQILLSLQHLTKKQTKLANQNLFMFIGEGLFITCVLLSLALYLLLFRPRMAASRKDTIFIMLMVLLMVSIASLTTRLTTVSIFIIPFAIQPIIVRIFFDSRTALFTHIITILLVAYMAVEPFKFVVIQVVIGMLAVASLKDLTQRSQLVRTASIIFLAYAFMYTSIELMSHGTFSDLDMKMYLVFAFNALLLLFAYVLIYIFEKLFGFLSDITLVELSNVNNKLLQQFSEKVPGTFQHSLQVSNLATEAAKKINANVLLVRTGALYHDIGKMVNPYYFTENQSNGISPLMDMDFEDAAKVVINHVEEGIKIAEKHNLPQQVIDFIRTHHGRNKVQYFYNSFRNKYPDKEIVEENFSYKGPLPLTKETAVLMMVDAVEAATKSLKDHSEEAISEMVERIIDAQIASGAFKNAPITFKNVEEVKEVLKSKLKSIYHVRISYPTLNVDKK